MIRRPPRSTQSRSSAASDVYKRQLWKYMMIILFVSHWLACVWHVTTILEDDGTVTWIHAYFCDGVITGCNPSTSDVYCASLYHSTMTLTTIGYGDVVANTTTERWVSIGIQLMGASLYAYTVGVASGIVASMNKEKMHFQETMDELNQFTDEQMLSPDLAIRLREYFQHLRSVEKLKLYSSLLQKMSPGLRGEVSMIAYGSMIQSVDYLANTGESFITQIALNLGAMVLSPGELVVSERTPATHLYFVADGLVSTAGRLQGLGFYFGEEVIMETGQHRSGVRAVQYCNLYTISRGKLQSVLKLFPRVQKIIRRAVMKLAFKRDIVSLLARLEEERSGFSKEGLLPTVESLLRRLTERDLHIQRLLDESTELQTKLAVILPQCNVFNTIRMADQEQREALDSISRLQEEVATSSQALVKESQYAFWRSRRSLAHSHMIVTSRSVMTVSDMSDACYGETPTLGLDTGVKQTKGGRAPLRTKKSVIAPPILPGGIQDKHCLLYTSPSPRDRTRSRMPSSA
eukprot:TRINITY_DN18291_c0_g1_i1.p1 TRINITY_DN18291_c0_g1~~TRINITY_DN18291_c0_g1_i1.p1  ORF type:complete len:518 (+),score=148.41 TRINITY_DN18291_c0_g1_i1:99-1652(+)